MSSLTEALDTLLQPDRSIRFKFVLTRKEDGSVSNPGLKLDGLTASQNLVIYQSNTSLPQVTDTQHSCRDVGSHGILQMRWAVCISPIDGYQAPWMMPLIIAVVLLSLLLSALVFMLMLSLAHHAQLVKAMLPSRVVQCISLGKTYAEPFKAVTVLFSGRFKQGHSKHLLQSRSMLCKRKLWHSLPACQRPPPLSVCTQTSYHTPTCPPR